MYQNLESHLLYEQKIMWKVLVLYESLSIKKLFFFGSTLTSLFQNKTMSVFVTDHGKYMYQKKLCSYGIMLIKDVSQNYTEKTKIFCESQL